MKVKTIKMSYPWSDPEGGNPRYRVEQITNSVEINPGTYLSRTQVSDFCNSHQWKVAIVEADFRKD